MKNRGTEQPGPVVACRSLTVAYRSPLGRRRVVALREFDLEVGRGEIVGILGPNGSGKTTLLKALLGLLAPAGGDVRLFGSSPRRPATRARVGFMPEENDFHAFLTVPGLLRLHASLAGLSRAEGRRQAEALMRSLGLEAVPGPLRTLSRGTVRKAALAQALLKDPELLLLDEPTSGIDPVRSEEVKAEILRRRDAGATVLLASHLLSDVEEMCDRLVVLHEGRTVCAGRTAELLADPEEFEFRIRGLADATRRKVISLVESEGAVVAAARPATRSLREFFLALIRR